MTNSILSPPAVADEIVAMHQEAESTVLAPLPPRETIVSLLETLFFAGLGEEEGRPTKTSIIWADPDREEYTDRRVFHLGPYPFTKETITKLAPASDRLVVSAGPYGIQIIGIALQEFDSPLAVRAVMPGVLEIRVGLIYFRYAKGVLKCRGFLNRDEQALDVFHVDGPVLRRLLEVGQRAVPEAPPFVLVHIRHMVARMGEGHGGVLALLPEPEREMGDCRFPLPVPAKLGVELAGLVTDFRANNPLHESDEARTLALHTNWHRDLVAGWCDAIARLTAVDGMTLLSTELTLVGFGAIVTCSRRSTLRSFQMRFQPTKARKSNADR